MRKLIRLMVLVVAAMAAFAGVASATSNKPNGTVVTGTSVSAVSFGGIVTCHHSHISGPLTNFAGAGVTVGFSQASFGNCTPSGTTAVGCNLPWDMHMAATTDGGNTWHGKITGLCFDLTTSLWGTCRYTGDITTSYVESADRLHPLTGQAVSTTQGFPCPSSMTLTATWSTTPTDLDIS